MDNKVVDLLKQIYLFKHFNDDELKKMAHIAEKQIYAPHDVIFYDGDVADAMFIIDYGSIGLVKEINGEERQLDVLGSGMHFGEMPFIDKSNRALTIKAIEKSEIYKITYKNLQDAFTKDSRLAADFYHEIAHFLAFRLRKTTTDLSFAKEKNLRHF